MDFNNLIAVKGQNVSYIGKLVYFTVGKTLIKEKTIKEILNNCCIDESYISGKYSELHAFKTATKLMENRHKMYNKNGEIEYYNIRILDNEKENDGELYVREIKKEIIDERKNKMIYLGNFIFYYENAKRNLALKKQAEENGEPLGGLKLEKEVDFILNPATINEVDFDLKKECEKIISMYEYAKDAFNENRIVDLVEKYIEEELDASKVNIHGKLYFIPIYKNEELNKLEQFFEMIKSENRAEGYINFVAIPVMNEEKYIEEYTQEYYSMAQEEIELIQKRLQYFAQRDTINEKIVNKWIEKIQKFMDKKAKYEEIFKRKLDDINDDIMVINRLVKEIEIKKGNTEIKIA